MGDITVQFESDDLVDIDLSREMIAVMADADTLCHWYATLTTKIMEVKEFVSAHRFAGVEDDDWYRRTAGKLGYWGVGLRLVEQRILELGGEPPYPLADPRNKQLREMSLRIKKLTGERFAEPETA